MKNLPKVRQPRAVFVSYRGWKYVVTLRWWTQADIHTRVQTIIGHGERAITDGTIIVDAANHRMIAELWDSSGFVGYLKIK